MPLQYQRFLENIKRDFGTDNLMLCFKDVWDNKFQVFRRDLSDSCESCRSCSHVEYCHGGSFHSWDFDNNRQLVCFKDILF